MDISFLFGLLAQATQPVVEAAALATQHPNWKAFPTLLVYVGLALGFSFLCSVLEATLLSTRVTELAERRNRGDKGAALMLELKEKRIEDAISAILTLNTIAHTIGAALAGAQADKVWGSKWVGLFSGVLTLLVLVCTEIIPKTLGTAYASRLTGFVARTTNLLTKLLLPVLFLTRTLTKLVSRGAEENVFSRGELGALVAMAAREGAIHKDESRVFENVLKFERVKVEAVMTPRTVVASFPKNKTLGEVISDARATPYSRIPVYEGTRDQVVGYVLLRELLLAAAHGADREQPIGKFVREVMFIPETASLAKALRQFLERSEHLAVAVDEFGGVSGLVTLEDVVETILGVEITDESDRVADLRELAIELRDKRLERVQKAQEALSGRLEAAPGGKKGSKDDAAKDDASKDKGSKDAE